MFLHCLHVCCVCEFNIRLLELQHFAAPTQEKEVEMHAKMLWVCVQEFSSWMKTPWQVLALHSLHFISRASPLRGRKASEMSLCLYLPIAAWASFPQYLWRAASLWQRFRIPCGQRWNVRSCEHVLGSFKSTFKRWKLQRPFCYYPCLPINRCWLSSMSTSPFTSSLQLHCLTEGTFRLCTAEKLFMKSYIHVWICLKKP